MLERHTWVQEVAGLIPCWVLPKTFQMVEMDALLGAQDCGKALHQTGWCPDKWTSSTGNLPRKRCDIVEKLLKAA